MAEPVWVATTDYHTAGEPFRIVTEGAGPLRGPTIMAKRAWAGEHLDHLRRMLVNEPRGHADMYGCFVCEPDDEGADLGVVFFHNEGYSTACGHGTIALVTWAIESGRLTVAGEEARVVVDVPSGRLPARAAMGEDGRVREVTFTNVPAYVAARDLALTLPDGVAVRVDVAFGGAFYASLPAAALGLRVEPGHLPELVRRGREIKRAAEAARAFVHPEDLGLRDVYGVIFHADEPGRPRRQRNVAVFADGEVDRSPCGSGTSARLALLHAGGELATGDVLDHRSIVDGAFTARVVGETQVAGTPAVVTEVTGSAHLTGLHRFVLAPGDPLGTGFLLR